MLTDEERSNLSSRVLAYIEYLERSLSSVESERAREDNASQNQLGKKAIGCSAATGPKPLSGRWHQTQTMALALSFLLQCQSHLAGDFGLDG